MTVDQYSQVLDLIKHVILGESFFYRQYENNNEFTWNSLNQTMGAENLNSVYAKVLELVKHVILGDSFAPKKS